MENELKKELKEYLTDNDEAKNVEMKKFINEIITHDDLARVAEYVQKLNNAALHKIVELRYLANGDLYIKTEAGMTFMR